MSPSLLRAALAATRGVEPRPPAAPERVLAFEAQFAITLPLAYRRFVIEVADGLVYDGASWLYSLDEIVRELPSCARPASPFWYLNADAEAIRVAVAQGVAASNAFTAEVMALQRNGDPDGCLTISSNGGNDFSVLVVCGEQAGWMWRTGELDFPESPMLYAPGSADSSPLDFDDWLVRWGECFLGLVISA